MAAFDAYVEEVEDGLDDALNFLSSTPSLNATCNSSRIASNPALKRSASQMESSTEQVSKKVGFASFLEWEFHSPESRQSASKTIPSSESKPGKSILKPSKPTAIRTPPTYHSFDNTLGLIQRLLRSKKTAARLQAYYSGLSAMETYNANTHEAMLREAAPSLLQAVTEDVQIGVQKISIAAFKFANALSRHLSSAGCNYELAALIDKCIAMLHTGRGQKSLKVHQLHFLGQNIHADNMTASRTDRLITVLRSIDESVPGHAASFYRLQIYRRLVEVRPAHMEARLNDWLMAHLYDSMLSTMPEIRQQAFALVAAASQLGPAVSKFVQKALEEEDSESKCVSAGIVEQLTAYLKHEDQSMALVVPQVCSATVLLLNDSFKKIGQWEKFREWWHLISQCFNSPYRQVRQETMKAWNCLIYVVMPDAQTFTQAKKMLRSPIEKQLAASADVSNGLGRTALSTYVCLLYYSLRPGSTFAAIDMYWGRYVSGMLTSFGTEGGDHRLDVACSILQGLFQSMEKWRENRVHEPAPFEIEELARLDPCWIRSRMGKVLEVVEAFLGCPQAWDSGEDDFENVAVSTWKCLLEAVKEAGAKEVTRSVELQGAIAAIVSSLARIGRSLQENLSGVHAGKAYWSLADEALNILGISTFTDKISVGFDSYSPITQIFSSIMVLSAAGGLPVSEGGSYAQSLVERCYSSMGSARSKLKLLVDFSADLQNIDVASDISHTLLEGVADKTWKLAEEVAASNRDATGQDFDAVMNIMKNLLPLLKDRQMRYSLYTSLLRTASYIGGNGAALLAVTEPFASTILQAMDADTFGNSDLLVSAAAFTLLYDDRPRNRGAIERGRKALWGGIATSQVKNPHEYDQVACLVERTLHYAYVHLSSELGPHSFHEFLVALSEHIRKNPVESCVALISRAQSGLCRLLLDESQTLEELAENVEGQSLLDTALTLWTEITHLIFQRERFYIDFEPLVLAGFQSRRGDVVDVTITTWNKAMDAYASLGIKAELPISIVNALDQINEIIRHNDENDDDYVPGPSDAGAASDSSSIVGDGSDDTLVDSIERDAPKSTPPTSPTLEHCDVHELRSSPPAQACAPPSLGAYAQTSPDPFVPPSPSPVRASASRGPYYPPTVAPAPAACSIDVDEDALVASQLQAEMDKGSLDRKRKYAAVDEFDGVPGGSGGGDPAGKRRKLLAGLLELVGECEAVASWTAEEQREAGELAFRLQAAIRGYVPRPQAA